MDFAELLLGGVAVFLDDFDFELREEGFLSLGETFAALVAEAFLLPLTGVADAEEGFSAGFWVSASFSSLGGAGNRQDHIKYFKKIYII